MCSDVHLHSLFRSLSEEDTNRCDCSTLFQFQCRLRNGNASRLFTALYLVTEPRPRFSLSLSLSLSLSPVCAHPWNSDTLLPQSFTKDLWSKQHKTSVCHKGHSTTLFWLVRCHVGSRFTRQFASLSLSLSLSLGECSLLTHVDTLEVPFISLKRTPFIGSRCTPVCKLAKSGAFFELKKATIYGFCCRLRSTDTRKILLENRLFARIVEREFTSALNHHLASIHAQKPPEMFRGRAKIVTMATLPKL